MQTHGNADSQDEINMQDGPPSIREVHSIVGRALQMLQQFMGKEEKEGIADDALSKQGQQFSPGRVETEVEKQTRDLSAVTSMPMSQKSFHDPTHMISLVNHKNRDTESSLLASASLMRPYPYARNVEDVAFVRPRMEDVFDRLLSARTMKRLVHPNGMTELAYASMTIVALDIFRSNVLDSRFNETSPYLDLSPLYGVNEEETNSIRVKDGRGMLAPDCFSENRSLFLNPTITALLILWNRNHNYYAEQLLSNNEGGRWRDPTSSPVAGSLSLDLQDDQIFKQARRINCAVFRNFIAEDLIKGLTGRSNLDNTTGLDFLEWAGCSSQAGEERIKNDMINIFGYRSVTEISINEFREDVERFATETSRHRQRRRLGFHRSLDGRVDDVDIARVLQNATDSVVCSAGARSIPPCMRVIEMMAMKQARDWNVCSLNDFRSFLGLEPYSSFSEWSSSSEIAAAARTMYGDIANLELLFPLIIPHKSKKFVEGLPEETQKRYDLEKPPIDSATISLETGADIHAVFENSEGTYSTPYKEDFKLLTKGTGFLLGFEEKYSHDTDKLMILYALIPDRTTLSKYAKSFRRLTNLFISKHSNGPSGGRKEVDIVSDVINRTCAKWVCDTICGTPLPGTDEQWVFEALVDLHNFIFQNYRKEDGWNVRSLAVEASKKLSRQIEHKFNTSLQSNEETIWGVAVRVYREMNEGLHVGGVSSDGFLERLAWWMESHQKDATSGNLDRPAGYDVDMPKIVANVLGLCIMTCASFAQVCSRAVDFYLQDERAIERKLIVELAEKNNPRDNAQIMGYIREAQRMKQPLVLTRVANRDAQISHSLSVKKGDCIVADFKLIHMNPREVPSPEKIDFKRQTPSIQGLGSHKCLGYLPPEESPEEISPNLSQGKFQTSWRRLFLKVLRTNRLNLKKMPKPPRVVLPKMKDYLVKATIALAALIALIIILYLAASIRLPEWPSSQQQTKCNGPFTTHTKPYHKYQAFSFVPGRGTDKPLPYKYTTKDKKPHRMTIMDADQRDMQFTIWIDGIIAGVTSDFVLDKSVDCGEVARTCWQKQFSMGIVDVPSGKHTVEIRWAGKAFHIMPIGNRPPDVIILTPAFPHRRLAESSDEQTVVRDTDIIHRRHLLYLYNDPSSAQPPNTISSFIHPTINLISMSGNTTVDAMVPEAALATNGGYNADTSAGAPAPYGEGSAPTSNPTRPQDVQTQTQPQTETQTEPQSQSNQTGSADATDPNAPGTTNPDELPEQRHAGAVGYGPNYQRGVGTGEKIGGKLEELKGKILKKPEVAEHGHLRQTGELQEREQEGTDPFEDPQQKQAAAKAPEGTAQADSQAAGENVDNVKTIG
ncbi:hypothetical protein HWV62_15541 [Athelia sp. TMB]|nr:hypothetical protein HWV62_15541 [Athelia sp. TMB]